MALSVAPEGAPTARAVFALLRSGAMDAEHGGGAALVAFAVVQHFDEQRDLEFAQGDLVRFSVPLPLRSPR
jgi:hypothetical protein